MSILRPFLSSVLSVSLAMGTVSISTAATAAPAAFSMGAVGWHMVDEPAAVLTLDSEDAAAAEALSTALRTAFATRGLTSSRDMSLVELRLTMGCDDDEPACLAQGGQTLGVQRLVYGYLRPSGSGFTVDMRILEVDGAVLDRNVELELTKADLGPDKIDDTAVRIVNNLLPGEDTTDALVGGDTDTLDEGDQLPPTVERAPRDRKVWFGLEKPTPAWKWAGFGTSLALALGSGVALAVLNSRLQGPLRDELHETADASLMDDNRSNDIDRRVVDNICVAARATPQGFPPEDEQGRPIVTNESVTRVCNKADDYRLGTQVAGAGLAVFGLSTLVFTGLLFIHRKKPGTVALRRHGVSLGAGPTGDGGVAVSGSMRF
jgi:hypothetical protein